MNVTSHPVRPIRSGLHIVVGCALVLSACSVTMRSTARAPLTDEIIDQLWVEPEDISARDLFSGPGGPDRAPRPDAVYRVLQADEVGFSRGYEVVDDEGRKWKIKLGAEAQSELVASRLLWAIGFHQPPMYAMRGFKLKGGHPGDGSALARFRLKEGYRSSSQWSWQRNPFVGTREFKGLIVAQLILNNWDFKTTNNRVYTLTTAQPGPRAWFVVQDLGASLGATGWPAGNRNDVDQFERQRLIQRVEPGRIVFDYHGRHRELLGDIVPSDVVWTCRLFAQLTDRQWQDAFRAAGYAEPIATRFIAKLQSKIHEGLALTPQSGNNP